MTRCRRTFALPVAAVRAFTLVELVAALALSAVLMMALLKVSIALNHSASALQKRGTENEGFVSTVALLRRDLTGCVNLDTGRELRISGCNWIDPNLMRAAHLPAEVIWHVKKIEQRNWLVREQVPKFEQAAPGKSCELVLPDVKTFEIQKDILKAATNVAPSAAEARRLPSAVRMKLQCGDLPVQEVTVLLQ